MSYVRIHMSRGAFNTWGKQSKTRAEERLFKGTLRETLEAQENVRVARRKKPHRSDRTFSRPLSQASSFALFDSDIRSESVMNDTNQWRVLEWCRVDEWLQTLTLSTDFLFGSWAAWSFYISCQMSPCQQLTEEDEFLERGRFWCTYAHVTGRYSLCLKWAVMHDRGGFHCCWTEASWLLLTERMEQKHNVLAHFFVCVRAAWMKVAWRGPAIWESSAHFRQVT